MSKCLCQERTTYSWGVVGGVGGGEGEWGAAILVAEQRSINYRSALTSSEPSRSWRVALLYAVHRGQCRTIIYSYISPTRLSQPGKHETIFDCGPWRWTVRWVQHNSGFRSESRQHTHTWLRIDQRKKTWPQTSTDIIKYTSLLLYDPF